MGLLDKLSGFSSENIKEVKPETESTNQKSNTVGLLKRSMLLTTRDRLDFFEFVNKYHFPQCAVFSNLNGNFLITDSYGFDASSIFKSKSTFDFWKGTINKFNEWNFFKTSNNSISPFYQFFSFDLQEKIKSIYIYVKESNDSISQILLIAFPNEFLKELGNDIIQDFEILSPVKESENKEIAIDNANTLFTYKLYFDKALDSVCKDQNDSEKLLYKKTIRNEIYFSLIQSFADKSLVELWENYIKLNFICEEELPFQLLEAHIQNNLQNKIGVSAKLLKIEKI